MPAQAPRETVLLRHACEPRICGEVRDARSTAPVADFVVHVSREGHHFDRLERYTFRAAEGRFAIPVGRGGAQICELRITAPGYAPTYLPDVRVEPQQDRYLSVELTRGSQLGGRVVNPAGEPVSEARIVAIPAREVPGEPDALSQIRDLEQYPDDPHGWTDARGCFVIPNAAPGPTILAIRHRDHPARNTDIIPAPDTGLLDVGTIRLDVGSVLRGRIRDGRRDRGVVQVADARGECFDSVITVAPNDAGAFELRGLPRDVQPGSSDHRHPRRVHRRGPTRR